GSPGLIPFGRS
uniref:Periviscerokinin-1 n=1 Tax=Pycnoscelus surinamensis TaxID=36961 RepID=PVK1_PYCSU|nr:RecName: Full=Periviscerokinin-1; Short=PycSu-PVK-1 [Pycnoscelus surinamensis]